MHVLVNQGLLLATALLNVLLSDSSAMHFGCSEVCPVMVVELDCDSSGLNLQGWAWNLQCVFDDFL